jgi:hypothetical protein
MTSAPFSEFLRYTKPGPQRRCTACDTYSLRTYTEPASQGEKVVCTNPACRDSPLHREG